ncbi:hypothetical protein BDA99DRAFT_542475 [Phascolomyces articulosus]|uniref:Uncharacterized protein n=1 Tax=Phascolomyces articulosus TaxID=60185 RepID=A0AAD5JYX5_9FUNG|nr:hypothetical protein BDA99DRAFT_542475 [Phascolomyces articulosus]
MLLEMSLMICLWMDNNMRSKLEMRILHNMVLFGLLLPFNLSKTTEKVIEQILTKPAVANATADSNSLASLNNGVFIIHITAQVPHRLQADTDANVSLFGCSLDSFPAVQLHKRIATRFQSIRVISSERLTTCKVFEFRYAGLPPRTNQFDRDLQGRLLIAIFQEWLLLNRQHGEFLAAYRLDEHDQTFFISFNTTFFTNFNERSMPLSTNIRLGLDNWIHSIQNYVAQNLQLTKTIEYSLTNEVLEVILEQARPKTVLGHTILALIGNDIPVSFFRGTPLSQSFLSGASRADHIVCDFLSRLQMYEQEGSCRPRSHIVLSSYITAIIFPSISCYSYFALPHIVQQNPIVSIQYWTCAITKASLGNFYSQNGILNAQFLGTVGIPTLQTFGTEEWLHDDQQQVPPPGTSIIIIPHFHPGRDKYGRELVQLRRLMDLALMIGIFIAENALSIITPNIQDRDDICRHRMDRCHPTSQQLDQHLAELYQLWYG